MSWLSDVAKIGDRVIHTDGVNGTIVEILPDTEEAIVSWDDGVTETVHEEHVLMADDSLPEYSGYNDGNGMVYA